MIQLTISLPSHSESHELITARAFCGLLSQPLDGQWICLCFFECPMNPESRDERTSRNCSKYFSSLLQIDCHKACTLLSSRFGHGFSSLERYAGWVQLGIVFHQKIRLENCPQPYPDLFYMQTRTTHPTRIFLIWRLCISPEVPVVAHDGAEQGRHRLNAF